MNSSRPDVIVIGGNVLGGGGGSRPAASIVIGNPVTGGGANRVLYEDASQNLAASANFLFSATLVNSGPGIQVGSGGSTAVGAIIGYSGTSAWGGIWSVAVTPSLSNAALGINASNTLLGSPGGTISIVRPGTTTEVIGIPVTVGVGANITAGTATTDVAALSITRTNNNSAVGTTVPWVSWDFTDTTSNAAALAFRIRGGAAASTVLLSVTKAGLVNAPAYAVGGAAGVSFGPSIVTSITVVNGIVTAIS